MTEKKKLLKQIEAMEPANVEQAKQAAVVLRRVALDMDAAFKELEAAALLDDEQFAARYSSG